MKKANGVLYLLIVTMLMTGFTNNHTPAALIDWTYWAENFTPAGYVGDWESIAMISLVPFIMLIAKKWSWFALFLGLNALYAYMVFTYIVNGNNPATIVIMWSAIVLLYIFSLVTLIVERIKKT